MYQGKAAISIYMTDATKKINTKILKLKDQEKRTQMQQTENFTSTVSHEMRTPLASILYFIKLIMQYYPGGVQLDENAFKYFKLIIAQVTLMQTFVDDLLDLRQLKDGVFSLTLIVFNASLVIEQVCSIFTPQANSKGLDLTMSISCEDLRAPAQSELLSNKNQQQLL